MAPAIPELAAAGADVLGGGAAAGAGAAAGGEAAGSAGALGGIMNAARGAIPGVGAATGEGGAGIAGTAKNYLALHGLATMIPGGGQQQQGQGAAPGQAAPAPSAQPPSAFMAHQELSEGVLRNFAADEELKSPSSQDRIMGNEDNDFDEKEKADDQKDKDLQVGDGVNDMGGTDQGPDGAMARQFDPNGAGAQAFTQMLPLLLGMIAGGGADQTGGHHLLDSLHEKLEGEQPGYLNEADNDAGHKLLVAILTKAGSPGEDHDDPALADNDQPHDPLSITTKTARVDGLRMESSGGQIRTLTAFKNDIPVGYSQSFINPEARTVDVWAIFVEPEYRGQGIARAIAKTGREMRPEWDIRSAGGPPTKAGKQILSKIAFDTTNNPLKQPGMEPLNTSPAPFVMPSKGRCSICGSTIDPNDAACPQCGSPNATTRVAAEGQGPETDEQKEAVAQLLLQDGREEEIPNMIVNPYQYADELTEITGQDPGPETPDPSQQPPPMQAGPPGGGMPVPGMSAPPPGAGAGMPGMMSSIVQYGGQVDGLAKECPNCGSHSTGYLNDDGDVGCKSCGHEFKEDGLVGDGQRTADQHVQQHGDNFDNSLGVDAADAIHQENHEQEQDSSHTWVDDKGDPLRVGQEYEMYSDKYDIPDIIRLEQVKPDEIVYTLTGEYGLDHRTTVSYEEANIENLHFVPAHGEGAELGQEDTGLDQNMEDIGRPDPGMTQTDLSTPHVRMTNEHTAAMTAQDFRLLADAIRTAPAENKLALAEHFANALGNTNPMFDAERFMAAAAGEPTSGRDAYNPQGGRDVPPVVAPGEQTTLAGNLSDEFGLSNEDMANMYSGQPMGEESRNRLEEQAYGPAELPCTNCGSPLDPANVVDQHFGDIECPNCGTLHNSGGQRLAPKSQWGEETGENLGDIYGPDPESPGYPYEARTANPETVNLEPNWEGMRAWVLNMAQTDPQKAQEIAREMGNEAPPELLQYPFNGTPEHSVDQGVLTDTDLEPHPPTTASTEETGPEWLMDGMTHTGGAKFTPNEQRDFIEEGGVARNADKLNLMGTHYEASDEVPDDQFLFGL